MDINIDTIDKYIEQFPKEVQKKLFQVRKIIAKSAPGSVETIKYAMPTFRLKDKNLVHFAAYKKHIGFYPAPSGITNFKKELANYKCSKGAIQFPLDQALPLNLISKIVKFRVIEMARNKK